jgi:hypothetical protein
MWGTIETVTGKRARAWCRSSGGTPKVQIRDWQVRMKLSGKKDPVADISGKSLRATYSWRDTDGAIL